MKTLFYSSILDLLIKVKLSSQSKSILYSTHRKLSDEERAVLEENLIDNIDKNNENISNLSFVYFGIDKSLQPILLQYKSIKPFKHTHEDSIRVIDFKRKTYELKH
jgi:hypothetical protein